MRKFIFSTIVEPNGTTAAFSPALPPSSSAIFSPSPSPSPQPHEHLREPDHSFFYLFPSIPVADSAFDLATLSIISALILLSLLSISFVFHLRLKSRRSHHLQNFSNIWSVRLLLVAFISLWAINEILRLPFFRRRYIYPFLPPLTLTQESNLCKIYVVFSLGLFEPGILITLLFLVNISLKKRNPNHMSPISTVGITCLPILLLQTFFVFLSPFEAQLPIIMHRSSVLSKDLFGNKTVMCTYPLFSCAVFAAFGLAYALGFLLSCWRVVSLVINKCIRGRINVLAVTIMIALPLQTMFLALSSLWTPENAAFGGVVLAMFLCVALCGAVAQCILVIKPTADALAAEADFCRWDPSIRLRPDEVDSSHGGEDRS